MSAFLEREKEQEKVTESINPGDHDKFAHYFRKTDLEFAWFDGKEITALCGRKTLPISDFTKFPVCPTCKEILEGIPA